MAAVTVGCAPSPIDLIPDFIPVLGYLDDLIILPILVAVTVKLILGPVMEECRREAEGMWRTGRPKRWVYSLSVIFLWLYISILIIKLPIK